MMKLLAALCFWLSLCAAARSESVRANTAPPAAGSSWCDAYRIGPGDVFDLSLYGRPELKREKVAVQPDGNLTYLQAANLRAAGLTVDELRGKLEGLLASDYTRPRVMVAPVQLRSKKYYIVGKAVENDAYVMDRPTTLVEALAKARGLETGLVEHHYADLADLSRSFLVRRGRRLPVSFEALFQKGDLSQNILIEPDDYIYIALARSADLSVFGEIKTPGIQAFSSHLTVVQAITARGGYTPLAYREKVLVVRGSAANPQTFVLNTNEVLKGRANDLELQPGDIVYVSGRPWKYAEDLLDIAVTAFIQAATTTYTGNNIPSIITRPILPQTNINN